MGKFLSKNLERIGFLSKFAASQELSFVIPLGKLLSLRHLLKCIFEF